MHTYKERLLLTINKIKNIFVKKNHIPSKIIDYSYFYHEKNLKDEIVNIEKINSILQEFDLKSKRILEIGIGWIDSNNKIVFNNACYSFFELIFTDENKIENRYLSNISNEKFDLIYISSGLEFMYTHLVLFIEIDKLLASNGKILIKTNYTKFLLEHSLPFNMLNKESFNELFTKQMDYTILFNEMFNKLIGRISKESNLAFIDKPINLSLDTLFYAEKKAEILNTKSQLITKDILIQTLSHDKIVLDENKISCNIKLNILIGCLFFKNRTGSELYVFELAKKLTEIGHTVSICSEIGEPLASLAKGLGIKLFPLSSPPGYKLGSEDWKIKTEKGELQTRTDTFYKIENIHFDILHLNHRPTTEHLMRLYPKTPIVCSIHSEVIDLEHPVISPRVKKYIAIRPEIKEYLITNFNISKNKIDIIYNPIDEKKFNNLSCVKNRDEKKRILFVGTIDYLRKETLFDLIKTTKTLNQELWIVGKKHETYLDEVLKKEYHIKYFPPTSEIEKFIHQCDETAGILLGRTTIEGWMCGKKGWIYDVNSNGEISNKKLYDVPDDIEKFKSSNVVNQINNLYMEIIKNK